jgi:8-oxo-dGTP diphosphatase
MAGRRHAVRWTESVAAPATTVAAVLAETWLLAGSLARFGVVLPSRPDQFRPGIALPVRIRCGGLIPLPARLCCDQADERGVTLSVISFGRQARLVASVVGPGTKSAAGTELCCSLSGLPAGAGRELLGVLAVAVRARAEQLVGAPLVVGTAIVTGGAVLAAQRERPAALSGRWEFPGGRVEAGEDEQQAVVRECQEELGAVVRVLGRLGPDLILPSGWLLRIHAAELVDGQQPAALEHRSLRWVRAAELDTLNWIDADRAVLPALRALLANQ